MKWFKRIRIRLRDMRTIKNVSLAAEEEAARMNELPPGSEHYVLAALQMPDGIARDVFVKLGANPDDFRSAIRQQYDDALRDVGIEPPALQDADNDDHAREPKPALYQAKPDVSTLFEHMRAHTDQNPDQPLRSASFLIGVAKLERGVSVRALKAMGISQAALLQATMDVLS